MERKGLKAFQVMMAIVVSRENAEIKATLVNKVLKESR